MRAVIQRVSRASVDVDNETIGSIERSEERRVGKEV